MAEETAAGYLDGRIDALREHFASLIAAAPNLPAAFGGVRAQIEQEWQSRPPGTVLGLVLGFILLGFVVEAGYRYFIRKRSIQDGSVAERLRSIGWRVALDLGGVAAFTLGSVAAFLAFDWPLRTRQAVVAFLAAFIAVRLVVVLARALLSPRDARLRILPASDTEAGYWFRRIALFAAWLALGWVIIGWLRLLGMDMASSRLVAYVLGLGLLAITVEAFWRRSRLAALYFVLVWALWASGARGLFWLAVAAGALPHILRLVQDGVDHALRPPGAARADTRGLAAAALGRGLRALVIIGAAWLLVLALGLDVNALASGDALWPRLLRGAVNALAVVLIADVIWLAVASLIDQKMTSAHGTNARLRTLLPIVRGTVAAVLIVMVFLMSLSALGVQVGPLIASAGVVGIAIGFGAQTLVRDMFSKFFYLLDDAFRVGEYIQSGN